MYAMMVNGKDNDEVLLQAHVCMSLKTFHPHEYRSKLSHHKDIFTGYTAWVSSPLFIDIHTTHIAYLPHFTVILTMYNTNIPITYIVIGYCNVHEGPLKK